MKQKFIIITIMLTMITVPSKALMPLYQYELHDGEAEIINCMIVDYPTLQLDIPGTINGYPVTVVGEDILCVSPTTYEIDGKRIPRYFYPISEVEKITIPESVKRIKSNPFKRGLNVVEIVLPQKIEYIENDAFSQLPNLKSINFPSEYKTETELIEPPVAIKLSERETFRANVVLNGELVNTDCLVSEGVSYVNFDQFANSVNLIRDALYFYGEKSPTQRTYIRSFNSEAPRRYILSDGREVDSDKILESDSPEYYLTSVTVSWFKDETVKNRRCGKDKLCIAKHYCPIGYKNTVLQGGELESFYMDYDEGYVPVRAIAEALGYDVDWDSESASVIITEPFEPFGDVHFMAQ